MPSIPTGFNPDPSSLAIIFDFGGVLMDWNPRYLYRKLISDENKIEAFLKEVDFFEWNKRQDAGRPFTEAVTELCAAFPQHQELIQAYDQRYEESLSGPISASVEILSEIKACYPLLYAISNWPAEKFAIVKRKYPFFSWFKDIVISGEVQLAKPDPRIFQLLLDRINRPADCCLLIDDSTDNIAAAQSFGMYTILFSNPQQLRRDLVAAGILS